jgi:hypothetical protein
MLSCCVASIYSDLEMNPRRVGRAFHDCTGSAFCCVGLVADVTNKDLLVNLVAAMLA